MNTDPSGLEDSVKPNIEDAQSFFDKAYEKIFTVNVPSDIDCDFRREMKLKLEELLFDVKDLTDEIDKYISDLKEVNAGTRKTVEGFTFGEMNFGMLFSDIPGKFYDLTYNWNPQRQEATRDLMIDAALGVGKTTGATIANSFTALLSGATLRDLMTDAALDVGNTFVDVAKITSATVGNLVIAFIGGVAKGSEAIGDGVVTVYSWLADKSNKALRFTYIII